MRIYSAVQTRRTKTSMTTTKMGLSENSLVKVKIISNKTRRSCLSRSSTTRKMKNLGKMMMKKIRERTTSMTKTKIGLREKSLVKVKVMSNKTRRS